MNTANGPTDAIFACAVDATMTAGASCMPQPIEKVQLPAVPAVSLAIAVSFTVLPTVQ